MALQAQRARSLAQTANESLDTLKLAFPVSTFSRLSCYRKSLSNSSNEIENFYRFLKKVVASAFEASSFQMGEHAHRQNREAAGPYIASNKSHDLNAVDVGQAGFEQHNVRWMLLDSLDSARSGNRNLGLKAGERQLLLQRRCLPRLIIDDENGLFTITSHAQYYYLDSRDQQPTKHRPKSLGDRSRKPGRQQLPSRARMRFQEPKISRRLDLATAVVNRRYQVA